MFIGIWSLILSGLTVLVGPIALVGLTDSMEHFFKLLTRMGTPRGVAKSIVIIIVLATGVLLLVLPTFCGVMMFLEEHDGSSPAVRPPLSAICICTAANMVLLSLTVWGMVATRDTKKYNGNIHFG